MNLTKQTIYETIDVYVELPKHNGNYFVLRNSKVSDKEVQFISDESKLIFDKKVTHWLKKKENVYILTEDEMKEFKKQIITDAYDSGMWSCDIGDDLDERKDRKDEYITKILNNN